MVRKNYFEILDTADFNPKDEFNNLYILLSNDLLEELKVKFLNYRNRGTFVSFDEFVNFFLAQAENELERLFIFAEFLIDILPIINPNSPYYRNDIFAIKDNIRQFLNLSNHEFVEIEDGRQIIVEKSVYASQASQIVSETNIQDAIKVLEYNHFANKGNIQRKKEILISLANYLEPLRTELNSSNDLKDVLKVQNNKVIAVEKVFGMYNSFGLRHSNDKQLSNSMNNDELEQWYDDIYSSTLFVILAMDESRILTKLNELKSK